MGKMSLSKIGMIGIGASVAGAIASLIAAVAEGRRQDELIEEKVNTKFEEFMNNFEIVSGNEDEDDE